MSLRVARGGACLCLAALLCGGCTVVTVASGAVSVAGSAVGAGITVAQVAVGGASAVAKGTASVIGGSDNEAD